MRLNPSLRRLALLASALLTVLAPAAHAVAVSAPISPNITVNPVNATIAPGKNATFTVKATGTGKLTYQWQVLTFGADGYVNVVNQTPFSGATTATLTIKAASTSVNNYAFKCIVTDGNKNTQTSTVASLAVTIPVTITAQPQATLAVVNGSANFTVVTNDAPNVSFQWFKNTTAISEATLSTLAINNVQASDVATYYVVVTNPTANITSAKVKLTLGTAPVVSNPADTGVIAGKSATFKVTATGTATLSYAWKVSTDSGDTFGNLINNSTIAGNNTATLTVKNTTQGMSGYEYECIVSNTLGSDTSDSATLTVGTVPVISTPTVSGGGSPVAGTSPMLTATLTAGSGTVSYQWFRNGAPLDEGSGSVSGNKLPVTITLPLTDVALGDAGKYTLTVSNGVGSVVTSKALTFTVVPSAGGIYFGTYSGTAGDRGKIAVVVDGENNIAVALHISTALADTGDGNNTGGIIPTFSFDENGAFSQDEGNSTFNGTVTGTSFNATYFSPPDPDDAANTVTITATPKLATGIQAANAGLYSGTFSGVNGQDQENFGGVTAILAADGTLYIVVSPSNNDDGNNGGGDNPDIKSADSNSGGGDNNSADNAEDQGGSGTVSAKNVVSFTIFDGGGSGTGKLNTNTDIPTITGNYTGGSNGSHGTFTLMLTTVGNFVDPDSGD